MPQTCMLLEGITVVSLEQYIAGPYCTQILADAGATVVKVERPPGGDPRRSYDPVVEVGDQRISGGFASYNRGKLSVQMDLADDDARRQFRELLETADVLVSNLRPGALSRSGFDPAVLRRELPELIICEITGFGTTGGPAGSWPAFDSVIQAMSGMSSLLGDAAGGAPQLAPMGTMDILSGTWAALGIALALAHRARTGEGAHIDAAMLDIGAAFLERPLALYELSGEVPTRGVDEFSPVGVFRAADDAWLSIVIPTDAMWQRLCAAIGREDLLDRPDLDSVVKRARAMATTIVPLLEDWARKKSLTAESVAERLRDYGQPVGVVQSIDQVRHLPQLEHRELFAPLRVRADGGVVDSQILLPTLPLMFDGTRARPGTVPEYGEHDDVLAREDPSGSVSVLVTRGEPAHSRVRREEAR